MTRRLLILAMVAAVLLAGCGSLTPFAAKVNGARITRTQVDDELKAILANKAYVTQVDQGFAGQTGERALGAGDDTFTSTFVAALLDRRISFMLVRQELARRKLRVSDTMRAEARRQLDESYGPTVFSAFPAGYRTELIRVFAEVATLQKALAEAPVTETDVRRYYERNAALYDQTCARHILVDTRARAEALRARIVAGEDFAAIARAESADRQGPDGGSAAKGGDLGCTPRGTFVEEFQVGLDALTVGQVSPPVQTQFGFHLIQLLDRKKVSLEEAATGIREELKQQAGSDGGVRLFVNQAVARAHIEVNPRYGRFEKQPVPGVKPPSAPSTASPVPARPTR